jgi:sec-independent protein translocase protein TatA
MFFRSPYADALIVVLVLLLFFGPKRLPALGKSLGQGMREFKDSISGKSKADEAEHPELEAATPAPTAGTPQQPPPSAAQPAPAAPQPAQPAAPPAQPAPSAPQPPEQTAQAPQAAPQPPEPGAQPAHPVPSAPQPPPAATEPAQPATVSAPGEQSSDQGSGSRA